MRQLIFVKIGSSKENLRILLFAITVKTALESKVLTIKASDLWQITYLTKFKRTSIAFS